MAGLIDWDVAARAAKRFSPPPPSVSRHDAEEAVAGLYRATAYAADRVAELTALHEPPVTAITRVVDRPAWIDTNAGGMRSIMDPLVARLTDEHPIGRVAQQVGGRVTGVQVGLVLGFLSGKVLGQFEFFERSGGQLLLVAPNIVAAERQLKVDPHDFRLWVCLHEVTHRTQFASAPWLHGHVRSLLGDYLAASDLDPMALLSRLRGALGSVVETIRGDSQLSLLEIVQTPEQRAVLDRVTGLMSLLEGHADVVMDGVGPSVVPSVDAIRARFEERRRSGNTIDRAVRRLLGLDLKMRQYAEGAEFVRAVVDAVGMDGLNRVWEGPELLPDAAEIRDPQLWLTRTGPHNAASA
jgi:coenzyme F420 biosynthesis associated uncharacterized protein